MNEEFLNQKFSEEETVCKKCGIQLTESEMLEHLCDGDKK